MLTSIVNTVDVTGSGVGPYTFNQPIHKKEDLVVYVSGLIVPLSGGSNPHTIVVAADKLSATITFGSSTGVVPLKFVRILEYKQETDLANNSLFDAESLETTLDNIVMQVQQVGNVVTSLEDARQFSFGGGIDDFDSDAATASTLNSNLDARKGRAVIFHATTGDIDVSSGLIDNTIDYTLEAEQWASKASGNVNTFTNSVENSDGSAISAKAQATAAATSAGTASSALTSFQAVYRGASGSAPGSPLDGQLWFDSTNDIMKVYNGTSSAWEQLTPTSSNQTNINAAVADASDIGRVAAIDTEIGRLGTSDMSVGASSYLALLGHTSMSHASTGYLKLVGDIDDKITNLGTTTVVGHITALNGTNVITHMAALNASNVITNIAALNASNVITNIGLVAAVDGEVADVAAIDTEIGTIVNGTDGVAGTSGSIKNILLISNVNGKLTEVGNLGTSAVVGYMTALNASGVIASMLALNASGVIADIEDVADVDGEITILGTNTNVTNMGLLAASGVIGNIATVATNLSGVNSFALRYRVSSSEPSSGNDAGDLYFNTTTNELRSYGTSWQATSPSAADQANINIVAGELTYEEDLGSIADAATTSSGNDISDLAPLVTEIGLLAARVTEMGRLGTAEIGGASTGALARLGTAAVVVDIGILGTAPNVLAMAELGTSTVVGHIANLNASGVLANIATVSGMVSDINRFATEYIISSTQPSSPSPTEGDLWYDSTNNVLKFHNGTSFVSISSEIHNEMVQDTSPTLGGNLDADSNNITNMGSISGTNLNIDFGSI